MVKITSLLVLAIALWHISDGDESCELVVGSPCICKYGDGIVDLEIIQPL